MNKALKDFTLLVELTADSGFNSDTLDSLVSMANA